MTDIPTGNSYDKYASANPIERRLMSGFWDAFDAALPTHATRILEVGIGEGEVMERLRSRYPAASIVGVDLTDQELQAEWRDRGLAASIADASHLPFQTTTFDLCLAIEVLEHVPQPEVVFQEIARVATDTVVLSVPREPIWRILNVVRGSYLRRFGNTPGHVNHWSRSGFRNLVSDYFTVQSMASPTPWTMVSARCRVRS